MFVLSFTDPFTFTFFIWYFVQYSTIPATRLILNPLSWLSVSLRCQTFLTNQMESYIHHCRSAPSSLCEEFDIHPSAERYRFLKLGQTDNQFSFIQSSLNTSCLLSILMMQFYFCFYHMDLLLDNCMNATSLLMFLTDYFKFLYIFKIPCCRKIFHFLV